jgi:hypothetical protein
MRGKPQLHYRDVRLFANAGMAFPMCYAAAATLDVNKGRLPTTADREAVTCPKCLKRMRKGQPPGPQRI